MSHFLETQNDIDKDCHLLRNILRAHISPFATSKDREDRVLAIRLMTRQELRDEVKAEIARGRDNED